MSLQKRELYSLAAMEAPTDIIFSTGLHVEYPALDILSALLPLAGALSIGTATLLPVVQVGGVSFDRIFNKLCLWLP